MTTDRTAARALVFDRVHRASAKRGMRMFGATGVNCIHLLPR
jgi:hypothetical protein